MAERHDPRIVRSRFLREAGVLRRAVRWKPYVFLAFGPKVARRRISWHYRHEKFWCAMIQVHGGSPRWRRRVLAELGTQGYERKRRTNFRTIASTRERDRELEWLRRFDGRALPARTPPGPPGHNRPASIWTDIDEVVPLGIAWSEFVLGIERRAKSGTWEILASMMVIVEPDGDVRRSMFVQLSTRQAAPSTKDLLRLSRLVEAFRAYETYAMSPTWVFLSRDSPGRADFDEERRAVDAWLRKITK